MKATVLEAIRILRGTMVDGKKVAVDQVLKVGEAVKIESAKRLIAMGKAVDDKLDEALAKAEAESVEDDGPGEFDEVKPDTPAEAANKSKGKGK